MSIRQFSLIGLSCVVACAALALVAIVTAAASDCTLLGRSVALPGGTVSSWSAHTGDRLLSVTCDSERATVTAGSGGSDLIFNRIYTYQDSYGWVEAQGERVGPWIRGRATARVPAGEEPTYVLAYVCEQVSGWQCGGGWRLQAYQLGVQADHGDPAPLKRVSSAEELNEYVQAASSYGSVGFARATTQFSVGVPELAMMDADDGAGAGASSEPTRVSETNVQVAGIDEPDIVKTDGETLFVSAPQYYIWGRPMPVSVEPMIDTDSAIAPMPQPQGRGVHVIDPFPASELSVVDTDAIEERGELLLDKEHNVLMVLTGNKVVAYNVANPASPSELWEVTDPDSRTSITSARLTTEGDLLLVTQRGIGSGAPCPVPLMTRTGVRTSLPCTDIWAPRTIEPVNALFTVARYDTQTGSTLDSITFAGESTQTVVSVFADNLYVTSRKPSSINEVMIDFYAEELSDFLGAERQARIDRIQDNPDLSLRIKMLQLEEILDEAVAALSEDDSLFWMSELENRATQYLKENARRSDQSLVTRVTLPHLTVVASAEVPGHLLNQFSMDEYDGYLRLASTIGDRWGMVEQENDVYVLDMDLDVVGSIEGLGLTEQIYAARFVGPRGYLVTFRQIDPFYVLDLADPRDPEMVGELKIPGFSSYLEPLSDDLVLGVGREGSQVKVSLFDVSDPSSPTEEDTYFLSEGWTEVNNNHRAFLRDPDHDLFFIPGGQGGYIFSWDDTSITLQKAVSGYGVRRAIYIDEVMYIIGDSTITALSLPDLTEVNELSLDE